MKTLKFEPVKNVMANIRKVRRYRGYRQEYLAVKLDISQNGYSKMETGDYKLTLIGLFKIAEILEVEVRDLIAVNHRDIIGTISNHPRPADL